MLAQIENKKAVFPHLALCGFFASLPAAFLPKANGDRRYGQKRDQVTTLGLCAARWKALFHKRRQRRALTLAEGATEGTFTSAVYSVRTLPKRVASWNAAIYDAQA